MYNNPENRFYGYDGCVSGYVLTKIMGVKPMQNIEIHEGVLTHIEKKKKDIYFNKFYGMRKTA